MRIQLGSSLLLSVCWSVCLPVCLFLSTPSVTLPPHQTAGMSEVTDDVICPAQYFCPAGTAEPDSNICTAGESLVATLLVSCQQ